MTDTDTLNGDALPAAATTKLAELKHLACAAVDHWNNGDGKSAYDALSAAMPAAAAAATALNLLLELDRASARAGERQRSRHDGVTRCWG
ncbi:hypothetical protein [Streptomyces sp. NRRL B-24484]|uniref:hypothetical protein n=1 Tax=Streptomyces sp. NRRL B-24484 TaxID=1463833 RepID=UPI0004C21924|nr:hypothetical protein [Streptomyces sp. NRRL B-24484]